VVVVQVEMLVVVALVEEQDFQMEQHQEAIVLVRLL
tara:strand:+ start:101 stop:208 length:108 start_codon:yes stop_codon:yes gene_type:complete